MKERERKKRGDRGRELEGRRERQGTSIYIEVGFLSYPSRWAMLCLAVGGESLVVTVVRRVRGLGVVSWGGEEG